MARKPRIEFAGAVYHVINRGDRGEAIYQDDEDRTKADVRTERAYRRAETGTWKEGEAPLNPH
jgi:hypothetical protein